MRPAAQVFNDFIEIIHLDACIPVFLRIKNDVRPLLARAKARASELSHLSHAEVVQRFVDAADRIRAEAIEKGTAIEGEWESD